MNLLILQHDSESTLTIIQSGNFSISPKEKLRNDHIYSGKDNNISITRAYNTDFDCNYQMEFYPFDIQQCNMNFILGVLYLKIESTPSVAVSLKYIPGKCWQVC